MIHTTQSFYREGELAELMPGSSPALLDPCYYEPRAPPREQTTYEASKRSRINLPFVRGAPKGAI